MPVALTRAVRKAIDAAERLPLRVRLVVAMLALVALAQIATGAAAVEAMRRYLIQRVDAQLIAAATVSPNLYRTMRPENDLRLTTPRGSIYVKVTEPNGTSHDGWLQREPDARPPDLSGLATGPDPEPDTPRPPTTVDSHGLWRVVVVPLSTGETLFIAVSLREVSRIVGQLVAIDVVVSVVVLALLGGVAYLVVRASLRPLRQVETVAAAITAGRLDQRVPERDPRTEVGRLGRAFNVMLAHIEAAIRDRETSEAQARASEERMRQFVADASHELRTPLTSVKGFAELYRQGAATDSADVARFMRRIEDESARMALLVEDLLLLARLDQQRPLRCEPVDLTTLAADAVHDARAVAPDRPIDLRTIGDQPAVVHGDEARLRQVAGNLVTNALTHTPAGTPVTVTVATADSAVWLEVSDRGPGLAAGHAARVFERFYRADASRTRHTGGSGLGLAIVAAIVAAHGGAIELDTAPGRGATFRVRLAAAQPPTHADPRPLTAGAPVIRATGG